MIKYLFFLISLLVLLGSQLIIGNVFHDINNRLDYFYKVEIKKCKIENTSEVKFTIGKGFYTQMETNCGNFPVLIEDYKNEYVIKKGTYISKKAETKEFEIISNDKKYLFYITSYKKYEITIRVLSFISALVVIIITYFKFW
ncbi:hypothetical protein [Empedobacter brevis]|uniref:Uncharacterized protein n=1 Tax=Empedobacter brevis NBRC 14943 = ATCC 43319 TaxID=1218108 RepID=A0A511NHW7_9FLAO|nr:hypothetical protein [Empedobacter brevis]GEM52402.1 hypothetical protein EB1_21920 [Empedobacter brevis NBRC 14943 = ATCC 43319]